VEKIPLLFVAKKKKLSTELKTEIATVERDINYTVYGGVLQNPDETLLRRGNGKGLKLYDEIEEDGHAYAVLQKRKLAVIARTWDVKPGGTSRKDKVAAELVKRQLENKLDQLTLDLLDATLKGFGVSEILWEDVGDEIVVRKFLARDQRRFTFAPDNSLRLLTLQNMVTGEALPGRKFIRHSFGAKDGSPFGRGLGSKLFFPTWFKRQGISFWLVFCEKFGMPTAVGKYPNGASEGEVRKLKAALEAIVQDAGVVIPEGTLIELLEATRSSSSDLYERLVRYMDEQVSEIVLGETLTTNIGNIGSRAAAETHNGVRLELSKADSDLLSATLNETYCVWVTELNVPGAKPPTVWRVFEEQEDLEKRSNRDKTLFDMGYRLKLEKVEEVYGEGYELMEDTQDGGTVDDDEFLKNSNLEQMDAKD
jgi:phage gp29-like protein